jgi:hypothetical protein
MTMSFEIIDVPCPYCEVEAGSRCRAKESGNPYPDWHKDRRTAYYDENGRRARERRVARENARTARSKRSATEKLTPWEHVPDGLDPPSIGMPLKTKTRKKTKKKVPTPEAGLKLALWYISTCGGLEHAERFLSHAAQAIRSLEEKHDRTDHPCS